MTKKSAAKRVGKSAAKKRTGKQGAAQAKAAPAEEPVTLVLVAEEEPKPVRDIHRYAKKETQKAFKEICQGLLVHAKKGQMGQTRFLLKISGLDEKPEPGKRRRGKSLSAMLLEELERSKQAAEAAAAGGDEAKHDAE